MRGVRGTSALGVAVLFLTACSTPSVAGQDDGGTEGATDLVTDLGVTDDAINLGILADLTGPFSARSVGILQGNQLVYDAINSNGGICGRQIELDIQNHGYDVAQAVRFYDEMEPNVLGMTQLSGSPMIAALLDQITSDNLVTASASEASTLLESPYILVGGATHDIEMINGIQWMVDQGKIAEGDTVGHIYSADEYGANGLLGARYAAAEHGLSLVEVQSSESALSDAISSLMDQDVSAILLTTTPDQTVSAVSAAASMGFDVPFLANNPAFAPALLDSPATPALEASLFVEASTAPYASDTPEAQELRDRLKEKFPDASPNGGQFYGYGVATIYASVIERACENGDLTRAGLQTALTETTDGDTGGIIALLDYSQPGASPSREIYIAQPSADAEGGLVLVEELFTTDLAQGYVGPFEG
ncbi:ABC transporter substrate-binding protein [soil metagenome]|jgi:ABC-type branched-subunit amino acid transport system substrate-binding protein